MFFFRSLFVLVLLLAVSFAPCRASSRGSFRTFPETERVIVTSGKQPLRGSIPVDWLVSALQSPLYFRGGAIELPLYQP